MPFVSEMQLQKIQHAFGKAKELRGKVKEKLKVEEVVAAAEVVGGGALAGYAHSRFADSSGQFLIPGLKVDALPVAGAALVALGYLEMAGKYDKDMMHVGSGVLAGFAFKKMEEIGVKAKANNTVFGALTPGAEYLVSGRSSVGAMTDAEYAHALRRSGL